MRFLLGGQAFESDNAAVLHYRNDILDGLYIDLDDTYAFVTEHDESHIEPILKAIELGVEQFEQSDDVDYTQPPHCWVVASVGRVIVATAEQICEEACDE